LLVATDRRSVTNRPPTVVQTLGFAVASRSHRDPGPGPQQNLNITASENLLLRTKALVIEFVVSVIWFCVAKRFSETNRSITKALL
jgi:hypothetical protein